MKMKIALLFSLLSLLVGVSYGEPDPFRPKCLTYFKEVIPLRNMGYVKMSKSLPFHTNLTTAFYFGWEETRRADELQVNVHSSDPSVGTYPCALNGPTYNGRPIAGHTFHCYLRETPKELDGTYDEIVIASETCSSVVPVYRTNKCPEVNLMGEQIGNCTQCEVPYDEGSCPGGNRVWAKKEHCVNPNRPDTLKKCSPPEACLGTRKSTLCEIQYAPNDSTDFCCTSCRKGYVRSDDDDCIPGWSGMLAWQAISFLLVIAGLFAVAWYGRRETIFLFPTVLLVFRLTQAYALTSLNLVESCSWGAGFHVEMAVFPMFTGLVDYLHEPSNAVSRFVVQLIFIFLYLLPLIAPAGVVWFKSRHSGLPVGEVPPISLLKRGAVTWFWLMIGPLFFVSLGQLGCADGVIANYPGSKCGNASHIIAILMGLILFGMLLYSLRRFSLETNRVSHTTDEQPGTDEDYLMYAFVYGIYRADRTYAWMIDLTITFIVVIHRSFFSLVPSWGASLSSLVISLVLGLVVQRRPFRNSLFNAAYITGLIVILLAQWVRYLRTRCDRTRVNTADVSNLDTASSSLQFSSIVSILLYVGVISLSLFGTYKSIDMKGTTQFHAADSYGLMNDDGTIQKREIERERENDLKVIGDNNEEVLEFARPE